MKQQQQLSRMPDPADVTLHLSSETAVTSPVLTVPPEQALAPSSSPLLSSPEITDPVVSHFGLSAGLSWISNQSVSKSPSRCHDSSKSTPSKQIRARSPTIAITPSIKESLYLTPSRHHVNTTLPGSSSQCKKRHGKDLADSDGEEISAHTNLPKVELISIHSPSHLPFNAQDRGI